MTIDRLRTALADRYRIERELGRGGMATVYLARDLKHDRDVAIKVLRPDLAAALGAERFLREITTTAGLRHPHILPLFDSGLVAVHGDSLIVDRSSLTLSQPTINEQRSTVFLFYVMPYVEGESLRHRLDREKQLPLDEALRITEEIAGALSYAQAHGVIHRDIKPENILLESGHAVVADFGIAKAVDAAGGETLTQTGLAIGTPLYMSPEQASGAKDVDGRSDQYALGCVLYEMLAGQPPFRGPTVESLVHQHLAVVAPPITNLRPSVPGPIAAALQRALAKTPADRFPTVAGFAEALHAALPASTTAAIPERRRTWAVLLPLGIVTVAAAVLIARALNSRGGEAALALGRQTQVTHEPGLEIDPALSRDGKLLAYSGANGVLFVRQVEGGEPIRVVRDGDGKGRWPAWTPDGERVVFLSSRGAEIVPALGGSSRLITSRAEAERGITLSPSGDSVAFVSHDSLFSMPVTGGEARLITASHELHSPAWSSDGRWVAFVSGNPQYVSVRDQSLGNSAYSSIQVAPSRGGAARPVTGSLAINVSPAWAGNGALLFVSDQEGSRDVYELRISRAGTAAGQPIRLTTGLRVHGIAVAHDGSHLAYSSFSETSNVWSLAIPSRGTVSVSAARPVTTGNQVIENMDVSHDGRWLAFASNVGGAINQLYRMRIDQSQPPVQLTLDSAGAYWSSWSPDDREIAFHHFRGERRQSFIIPLDGGQAVPVTDGTQDERSAEWSPDGRHLVLLANWATRPTLHIIDRAADGSWSAPRALPVVVNGDTLPAGLAVWSPDGRFLACGCGPGGLVLIPVPAGPARRLPSPFSTAGWDFPQWSADSRTIYHLSQDSLGKFAVVGVPISGAPPRLVMRFDDPALPWHRFGFRVRGDRMFFTLGDQESDVWVTSLRGADP